MAVETAIERTQGNPDIHGMLTSVTRIDMRQVVSMRLALVTAKAQGSSQEEREEYDQDIADITLNPTHVSALQQIAEFLRSDTDARNLVSQVIGKRTERIHPTIGNVNPHIKTTPNDPQEAITYANQATAAFLLSEALETIALTDETELFREESTEARILNHVRQALIDAQIMPVGDEGYLSAVLRSMTEDFSFDQESYVSLTDSLEGYIPDSLIVDLSVQRLKHQAGIDNLLAALSRQEREELFGEKGTQKALGKYITSISELSRSALEGHIINKKDELERLKKNLVLHIKEEGHLNDFINTTDLSPSLERLATAMLTTSFDLRHLTEQLVSHQAALEPVMQEGTTKQPTVLPTTGQFLAAGTPPVEPTGVEPSTEEPRIKLTITDLFGVTNVTQQDYSLSTHLPELLQEANLQDLAPYLTMPRQRATLTYPMYYEAIQQRIFERTRELVHEAPLVELFELQESIPTQVKEVIREELAERFVEALRTSMTDSLALVTETQSTAHMDLLKRLLPTKFTLDTNARLTATKTDINLSDDTLAAVKEAIKNWGGLQITDFAHHPLTKTERYILLTQAAKKAIDAQNVPPSKVKDALEDIKFSRDNRKTLELCEVFTAAFGNTDIADDADGNMKRMLQELLRQADGYLLSAIRREIKPLALQVHYGDRQVNISSRESLIDAAYTIYKYAARYIESQPTNERLRFEGPDGLVVSIS